MGMRLVGYRMLYVQFEGGACGWTPDSPLRFLCGRFRIREQRDGRRRPGVDRDLHKGKSLRIHDLRHFTASTLTGAGVEDNIISLLTGHKSRELRRYQHLREELKRKTVDLIAGVLKDAGKNSKGASSSRLLHGAGKKAKSEEEKSQ